MLLIRAKNVIVLLLVCVLFTPNLSWASEATGFKDIQGHWAEATIQKWIDKGWISGQSANRFNPGDPITRAELAMLVNTAFGYAGQGSIDFKDVAADQWYYKAVAAAVNAGYMKGYENGEFRPGAPISRQELAVLISRILKLTYIQPDPAYSDVVSSPAWSKGAIGAVLQHGVMNGTKANQFSPVSSTTRAEAVVILERALGVGIQVADTLAQQVEYDAAGIYGSDVPEAVEGAVVVSAPGVTLKNMTIAGDLLLADSIGEGEIVLQGVSVGGRTLVQGGGENSIYLENSQLGEVQVDKVNGNVRLKFDDKSGASHILMHSGGKVEAGSGSKVQNVELGRKIPAGAIVSLDGSFMKVTISAKNLEIKVNNGTVGTLHFQQSASDNWAVLGKNSRVSQLTLDAVAKVTGEGEVSAAAINVNGVELEQKPGKVDIAQGIDAVVGGIKVSGAAPVIVGGGGGGGPISPPPSSGGGIVDVNVQDALFPNEAAARIGSTLILAAAPQSGVTVWFAPLGTTVFAEGPKMTRLVGNGSVKEIEVPATEGFYRLYVVANSSGTRSSASAATLTADRLHEVRGQVVDHQGQPIASGELLIVSVEHYWLDQTAVIANGTFRVRVLDGEYLISRFGSDILDAQLQVGFEVADGVIAGESLVITVPEANVTGTVTGTYGAPYDGIYMLAYGAGAGYALNLKVRGNQINAYMEDGDYYITGTNNHLGLLSTFKVEDGVLTAPLFIVIPQSNVSGRVKNAAGDEMHHVELRMTNASDGYYYDAYVLNGAFNRYLPDGIYTVTDYYTGEGYGELDYHFTVLNGVVEGQLIDILISDANVFGTVLDQNENMISSVYDRELVMGGWPL